MNSIHKITIITQLICVLLCQNSIAGDLKCKLIGIKDANIEIEVENASNGNLIIMGGSKDELVRLGVAFVGANGNHIETTASGRHLAVYEMPDLIYLPSKYKRVFKFEIKKIANQSKILQVVLSLDYLTETNLRKKLEKDPSWNFTWDQVTTNLIFNKKEIEKFKQYYSFGSGLPGFGIKDVDKPKSK